MTDTPQWPIVERRKTPPPDDDTYEFPPLIYPRPLVDKALLDRTDDEEEL